MKKIKHMEKKAQARFTISDMGGIAIALVVAAVILGLGGTILDTLRADQPVNGTAYNATGDGLTGLGTMSSFLPTIAIVAVAAIVIGIILVFFGRGQ